MKNLCPVCKRDSFLLDVVDFNKSCEEARGYYLPLSAEAIYYALCPNCGFCFAPEIYTWDIQTFADKIYNSDYAKVDPDYSELRPRSNAEFLINLLGNQSGKIRHLDYGGGSGLLSQLLNNAGWQSTSYDPFVNTNVHLGSLGEFDFITAFEVFEHVPNLQNLLNDLSSLLTEDGVVLFTTLLSDGQIEANKRITWWYASPRNGHISLFSKKSLAMLCENHGFQQASFSAGLHVMLRQVPDWAKHFIKTT